ncbi:PREDICTED: uncharacterized protein LOC106933296 [Poecilia mexicana]|uniref:uncharacterized protein LOC106933296 n=1 Tax=Poecilia mexicana TaxID=48701 RepID=UPI00072E6651|nr:PREDICTED: uncharacterized protein LOC106933296 [Poecilia mexicana]
MGALVPLLETTWPWSDLSARPCLASAASELHFSPGSPEETPLHTMLFLPAAALCWLGSALAAMATPLVQKDLTLTRNAGETVAIRCSGFEMCDSNFIYWYQKKTAAEHLVPILRIDRSGEKRTSTFDHPLRGSFTAMRKDGGVELVISGAAAEHSATYYCVCHKTGSHSAESGLTAEQKPSEQSRCSTEAERQENHRESQNTSNKTIHLSDLNITDSRFLSFNK